MSNPSVRLTLTQFQLEYLFGTAKLNDCANDDADQPLIDETILLLQTKLQEIGSTFWVHPVYNYIAETLRALSPTTYIL